MLWHTFFSYLMVPPWGAIAEDTTKAPKSGGGWSDIFLMIYRRIFDVVWGMV
jgi:hypothetical protein